MEETKTFDIYSIYKRTLAAVIISAMLIIAGTICYVIFVNPIGIGTPAGVQSVSHGSGQAPAADGGADGSSGTSGTSATADTAAGDGFSLFLNGAASDSEYLWIPVDDGISSTDITIENHYMDRQLWVSVANASADYYKDAYISGNLDGISYAEAVAEEGRLVLKFNMDHVYEYDTIFEDGVLYVAKKNPREVYDRIVVLDPAGSVPDEFLIDNSLTPAGICQDISSKTLAKLEDAGIRVYVTSLDERVASNEDGLALLGEVKPDMYIRIETSYDADTSVYGTTTVYNGTYFIPAFGSVELADMLEAGVTVSIGGKASGLVEAGEDDEVIRKATVPAAAVKVGYYTNTQENILLNRDDYRTRIADGIADAVSKAYGDEDE